MYRDVKQRLIRSLTCFSKKKKEVASDSPAGGSEMEVISRRKRSCNISLSSANFNGGDDAARWYYILLN